MRRQRHRPRTSQWVVAVPIALIALGAGGCIIPRFDADCPETADCGECLENSGCGFCVYTNRCLPGTAMGPEDYDLCAPVNWRFNSCDEPPGRIECPHDTCGVCLVGDDDECGWCDGQCWPASNPPSHCTLLLDYDSCD